MCIRDSFGDFRWKCGAGPVGGVLRSRGGESLEPNKSAHKKDSAQNDRLWAGRFNQPQDMLFDRLNASLPYDRILAPYDIRGSKVHVGMLGSIGVLDGKEVDVLTSGLDQVLAEYETGAFPGEAGDEDIHMAVERRLTEIVGPVGGKVHTAVCTFPPTGPTISVRRRSTAIWMSSSPASPGNAPVSYSARTWSKPLVSTSTSFPSNTPMDPNMPTCTLDPRISYGARMRSYGSEAFSRSNNMS